jgi:glutathione S-transferase
VEVVSPFVGEEARTLTGIHLYHYGLSPCSQKVRLALAEKRLAWTSHPVDLGRGEQRTDLYRRVNPNGLVPTLVDDGTIHIESSDIMEHLDERFPEPALRPVSAAACLQMRQWIARQDSVLRPLDILSREFLLPAIAGASPPRPARSTVAGAIHAVDQALAEVNRHLNGRTWMVGDALSLADIAWLVVVHRFALLRFPMWRYPALRAWYHRIRRRPSFLEAIACYEPPELRRRIGLYAWRRWLTRSDVGAPMWRDPRLLAQA